MTARRSIHAETADASRLMTVREAAARCRVSVRSMWRHIDSGALQIVRIGRAVRIRPTDLEEFIEARLE